ncbi:MAG: DUF1934 domain-containing protein [Clostridia bacterium]|nr:DUF1934 domain-containing protein [Clostridia bacterium]
MNALVSIIGTQSNGPTQDSVEMLTEAVVEQIGEITDIRYKEPDENGFEECYTHIRAVGNTCITITRSGKYASQLILEKGQRHLNHYDMGFGQLVMGVSTSRIENTLDANGGALTVNYTLEMNHSLVSNNRFVLKIVEVKHDNQ